MDMLWMHEAFTRVRKDGALGVDGVSAEDYAQNLDANLADLLERAKSGRYRCPPTRRVEIPKNGNETRPINIPTFEDKVLQRAIAMLIEPICETDFLDVSYGFRPNRSQHQALDALRTNLKEVEGGWVVDVDIRKYFDTIPHAQLNEILRLRVNDSVVTRLIAKWLRTGALQEDGTVQERSEGTPQGGVISPLLSNIYLHHVLDQWFETDVRGALKGTAKMIRFADDMVAVFERLGEAQRFMRVLKKRFEKFGLTLHPEKTKLVDYIHPWKSRRKPETFDFLGFTHYWGKTKKGGYAIKKKTSSKKMRAGLKKMHEWCKRNRHKPMAWQHKKLCEKLQGHYAYYGITTNSDSIGIFRHKSLRIWRYWLNRRSRKRDGMDWKRFSAILKGTYPVPYAHVVHKTNRNHQQCMNV